MIRAYFAHHAGMTLVALVERAARRSNGEPLSRRPARAGHRAAAAGARAAPHGDDPAAAARRDAGRRACRRRCPTRRFRSPHTVVPHAQFLSNGNYLTVVTNAGGGSSFCRGLAVTKSRRDATRDPGTQCIYLRDVRSGSVWSATYHPTAAEPDDYVVEFRAERATFRRHDDEVSTQLDIAVSTEDDVEVRRRDGRQSRARGSARSTSPATPKSCWRAPPTISPTRHSASCFSKPNTSPAAPRCCAIGARGIAKEPGVWAMHVREPRRPAAGADRMGDRSRTVRRPRPRHRPSACARRRRAVGHDRHRARSDPQPAPANPAGSGRVGAPVVSRPASRPIARRPKRWRRSTANPSAASRTFALAFTNAQSGLRHLGMTERRRAPLRAPRVAACSSPTARSARARRRLRPTSSASPVCGRMASPATCPSCSCASSATLMWRWSGRSCRRRNTGG